jgi:predicted NUDIX family NTP pyrophosphohydrolase
MKQRSAGLLLYRWREAVPDFFLVHPGGPFWARKDEGAWSIPKGLCADAEEPLEAAKREFSEETGFSVAGEFIALGEFRQPSGKTISAWAVESDCDSGAVRSNTFTIEWPPKSGRTAEFPEVDRAGWFAPSEAFQKILRGQTPILEAALALINRTRAA